MSWQLASFAIVLGALALAFWWYERSRPSAKLLAVVATLAALAALGRDAFAAVPDVKPITAIVLVSGVAFGAGPGFAVGAISGLASNILLGQGPWTPWQMLGWGLVGLIGAALSRPLGPRPSRVALALACALGAGVFNLLLDLSTWTAAGNHSLAAFGVVLSAAFVFDLTHVVASFAFGLAFGGVLLRMLLRVRSRLDIDWVAEAPPSPAVPRPTAGVLGGPLALLTALLVVGLLAIGPARPAHAAGAGGGSEAAAARVALTREVSYLAGAQNSDGGFGGDRGQSSSELYSAWAAIGLAAAGHSPLELRRDGHTVLDAIRREALSLRGAGDLERTILALRAAGASTHSLLGGDPVVRLLRMRSADGSFAHLVNQTAFALLALRAAGHTSSSPAISAGASWLARQQEADGGFGFAERGGGSDVDDTAAVLQALAVAGRRSSPVMTRGLRYLMRAQNLDGGYPQEAGGSSNAQSTSWAIQGLIAGGRDVERVRRAGSRTPLGYLESLIASDGSVRYSRTGSQTPVWVTAQALTALSGKPLPIAPVGARRASASTNATTPAVAPVTRPVTDNATSPPDGASDAVGGSSNPAMGGLEAGTRALRALLRQVLVFLER
jgi:energy-coupling factor transport system substrate-specific component